MSKPSFTLFRKGPHWWARFTSATGKEVEFSTKSGDRAKAEGIAETLVPQKVAMSKATVRRWANKRKTVATVKASIEAQDPKPSGGVPTVAETDPPAPAPTLQPPAPAQASPSRAPVDPAILAGKLRALGDGQEIPIHPDELVGPGDKASSHDGGAGDGASSSGDEGPADNEAGELLADMLAIGTISFIVRMNAKIAKKRKPPVRLAEPDERMTDWAGKGLSHNYRKLVGNAGALGPTGKMFVGIVGMCLTMWWGAEEVGSTARPSSTTAAAASPGQEGRANGVSHDQAAGAPTPAPPPSSGVIALGRFQ
jgi:hypothetical protein